MTENEAIKIFNDLLDVPCEMLIKYDSVINSEKKQALVRLRTAEEFAIKALEKQIPKKPNKAIDRSWGIENEVNVCPVCDCYLTSVHFISIDENEVKGTDKVAYCETCGQKIDYNE